MNKENKTNAKNKQKKIIQLKVICLNIYLPKSYENKLSSYRELFLTYGVLLKKKLYLGRRIPFISSFIITHGLQKIIRIFINFDIEE